MKKAAIIVLFLLSWGMRTQAQTTVRVVKFDQLEALLAKTDDTLRIVNFWATWCAPCIKELPYFERLRQQTAGQNVRVFLVSMDDLEALDTKVKPFVRKKNLQSPVWLLNEPDPNTYIDRLAADWSGALPMTLIVNKKQNIRTFIGKAVTESELQSLFKQYKH